MSQRQFRKVYGGNSLPPPEGDSDEEYEPLYAKESASQFKFQGLEMSSNSEHESTDAVKNENTSSEVLNKKKKKKKKKQRDTKPIAKSTSKRNLENLDEIDKTVLEVNSLLGTPEPSPSVSSEKPARDTHADLIKVNHKHINVNNELTRLFGPEEPGPKREQRRQTILNRLRRKVIIVRPEEPTIRYCGLSMSILRRDGECTYFIFNHNRRYQKVHRNFLELAKLRIPYLTLSVEDAQENMHIEGMLENADMMFRYEANNPANSLIEDAIVYMQSVFHPLFNLTDKNIRLEYRYMENRAFHIAVLKYLHLLTNRACHRTALELAKLLLNLDPTDPLAVILIIDTLALRAREHQWLIDAVDYWAKERDAKFLMNMSYSYAMAHYHVAVKNKANLEHADRLLKDAMMRFPSIAIDILKYTGTKLSAKVQECSLFSNAEETTIRNVYSLMALYAKFTCSRWREPEVFGWFNRNLNQLAESIAENQLLQERVKELSIERLSFFQGWPDEIIRHLSVISPMANLLVDGAMPEVPQMSSADPVPPANGLSCHGYACGGSTRNQQHGNGNSPFYEFFFSISPQYELNRARDSEVQRAAAQRVEEGDAREAAGAREGALNPPVGGDTDTSDTQDEAAGGD